MTPKKLISMRLDDQADALLANLSTATGEPKSALLHEAITDLWRKRITERITLDFYAMIEMTVNSIAVYSEAERAEALALLDNISLIAPEGQEPSQVWLDVASMVTGLTDTTKSIIDTFNNIK